ncbi:hypothetical protein K9U39_03200 [Rhodoblastus acidophilus]|nr:hypothetical protein [Rhodoblastus acidophilus]
MADRFAQAAATSASHAAKTVPKVAASDERRRRPCSGWRRPTNPTTPGIPESRAKRRAVRAFVDLAQQQPGFEPRDGETGAAIGQKKSAALTIFAAPSSDKASLMMFPRPAIRAKL